MLIVVLPQTMTTVWVAPVTVNSLSLQAPFFARVFSMDSRYGVNRSFGALFLFGRNTGVASGSLPACRDGVFPKPCTHAYLTLEPTCHGERQGDKSNS